MLKTQLTFCFIPGFINQLGGIYSPRQSHSALFCAVDFPIIFPDTYGMAARRNSDTTLNAIRDLKARGYKVKRAEDWIKRGLEVHREVYTQFTEVRRARGMRAWEALAEAMQDWIKAHEAPKQK